MSEVKSQNSGSNKKWLAGWGRYLVVIALFVTTIIALLITPIIALGIYVKQIYDKTAQKIPGQHYVPPDNYMIEKNPNIRFLDTPFSN